MSPLIYCTRLLPLCFIACLCGASERVLSSELDRLLEGAKQGSKVDLYNLGVRYGIGDGVREDLELSFKFYLASARRNYAPAQNNLGWAYRQGLGVRKSAYRAIFWFRLSAIQGNALALQNLGEMYQAGEGVKADMEIAENLFTLCAVQPITDDAVGREAGFNTAIAECRKEMGKMAFSRAGDSQERLLRAAFWYRLSLVETEEMNDDSEEGVRARRTMRDTIQVLEKIEEKLTADSVDKLTKRLNDWDRIRDLIEEHTAFPLTELDCEPERVKL